MKKVIYRLEGNNNSFLQIDGKHIGQFFTKEMAEAAFSAISGRNDDYRNN